MDINEIYNTFLGCDCLTTDSREVAKLAGDGKKVMFVALKGENFDGNEYAAAALDDGAEVAVVSDGRKRNDYRYIHVNDTLKTLQALAFKHRNTLDLPVIGITGSNGKTTTKELCHAVLGKKFRCAATKGNLNNHIGVPLTLLSLTKDDEIAIIEMGANHCGEIQTLANIAAPDYGIITNIGKAHLEGFGGEEGIIKGKGELFDYLDLRGKTAIYNRDIEKVRELAGKYKNMRKSEYSSDDIEHGDTNGFLSVILNGNSVNTHLVGDFNLYNIATAHAVGKIFGVPEKDIADAIGSYVPDNNRSQMVVSGSNRFIIDAYNANPSSMRLSLENFGKMDGGNKAAVLGDMKELGEYSLDEHIEVIKLAESLKLSKYIFVGEEFKRALSDYEPEMPYIWCGNVDEAKKQIENCENSVILVKGSNSIGLKDIIER